MIPVLATSGSPSGHAPLGEMHDHVARCGSGQRRTAARACDGGEADDVLRGSVHQILHNVHVVCYGTVGGTT